MQLLMQLTKLKKEVSQKIMQLRAVNAATATPVEVARSSCCCTLHCLGLEKKEKGAAAACGQCGCMHPQ